MHLTCLRCATWGPALVEWLTTSGERLTLRHGDRFAGTVPNVQARRSRGERPLVLLVTNARDLADVVVCGLVLRTAR